MKVRCASRGCTEEPVVGVVAVSEEDDGDGTYYNMWAACRTHMRLIRASQPLVVPDHAFIRFEEVEL